MSPQDKPQTEVAVLAGGAAWRDQVVELTTADGARPAGKVVLVDIPRMSTEGKPTPRSNRFARFGPYPLQRLGSASRFTFDRRGDSV